MFWKHTHALKHRHYLKRTSKTSCSNQVRILSVSVYPRNPSKTRSLTVWIQKLWRVTLIIDGAGCLLVDFSHSSFSVRSPDVSWPGEGLSHSSSGTSVNMNKQGHVFWSFSLLMSGEKTLIGSFFSVCCYIWVFFKFFFTLGDNASCTLGLSATCYVTETGLELLIPYLSRPSCWDHRHKPLHLPTLSFFLFLIFMVLYWGRWHPCEGQRITLFPICEFWRSNSGHQPWWPAPLLTGPLFPLW